jgi:hypothetical protein
VYCETWYHTHNEITSLEIWMRENIFNKYQIMVLSYNFIRLRGEPWILKCLFLYFLFLIWSFCEKRDPMPHYVCLTALQLLLVTAQLEFRGL